MRRLLGAGIVLLYHGLALRSDQRLVAATATDGSVAGTVEVVTGAAGDGSAGSAERLMPAPAARSSEAVLVAVRRRSFALVGPEDELDAALLAARAALPPGIEIVDAEG